MPALERLDFAMSYRLVAWLLISSRCGPERRSSCETPCRPGVAPLVLADLRPGDELVIVIEDDASTKAATDATATPSAMPRPPASTSPRTASEVVVFREAQTP